MNEPTKTSGSDMQSHMIMRAQSVPKGIAVLEACAQTKRLRMKTEAKRKPGKRRAVYVTGVSIVGYRVRVGGIPSERSSSTVHL